MRIIGAAFKAAAGTDALVIKELNDAGVVVINIVGNGSISWDAPMRFHPYLDKSACTITGDGIAILYLA